MRWRAKRRPIDGNVSRGIFFKMWATMLTSVIWKSSLPLDSSWVILKRDFPLYISYGKFYGQKRKTKGSEISASAEPIALLFFQNTHKYAYFRSTSGIFLKLSSHAIMPSTFFMGRFLDKEYNIFRWRIKLTSFRCLLIRANKFSLIGPAKSIITVTYLMGTSTNETPQQTWHTNGPISHII